MTTITAKPNQSMQDLVLMACGSLDGAMAFCRANGVSISDVPVAGDEYVVPTGIDVDDDALTTLAQKGIEIGTLNAGLAPHFGIILYPMMAASVVYPVGGGLFDLVLAASPGFIHANELPDPWTDTNLLKTMLKSDYDLSGVLMATVATPYATLQSDKETRYFIDSALVASDIYMWWSDLPTDFLGATVTYEDIAGWRATCAPLVLMPTVGMLAMHTLIGTISLAYDGTAGPYSFAITKGHTPIIGVDAVPAGQGLAYRPAGTSGIWTNIPTTGPGEETVTAAFTPGIYELILWTQYTNSTTTGGWPASVISMVFEVY